MNELSRQLKRKFAEHSKRGFTQSELAISILRVNVATAGNWLRGKTRITSTNNVAVVQLYIVGDFDDRVDELIREKGGTA